MSLSGKVALVTGASKGIGREIALLLAKEGINIAINYNSDEKSAKEVLEEVKKNGVKAEIFKADVSCEDDVKNMMNEVSKNFGGIDFLVNNAGIDFTPTAVEEFSLKNWNKIINTNLTGTFLCTKYAIPHLKKSKNPSIVNIASRIGIKPIATVSAYCSSKAAVRMFTNVCALEFSKYKIRVNVVSPGLIETQLTKTLLPDKKIWQEHMQKNPLKRIGKSIDVANAVLFFISDKANFINGAEIRIDGGMIHV